uniref:Uncharacterized protein n=1 Tax=Haemonchus contortus TaxID=6289 RepID=A0A7I5EE24_HAECO
MVLDQVKRPTVIEGRKEGNNYTTKNVYPLKSRRRKKHMYKHPVDARDPKVKLKHVGVKVEEPDSTSKSSNRKFPKKRVTGEQSSGTPSPRAPFTQRYLSEFEVAQACARNTTGLASEKVTRLEQRSINQQEIPKKTDVIRIDFTEVELMDEDSPGNNRWPHPLTAVEAEAGLY